MEDRIIWQPNVVANHMEFSQSRNLAAILAGCVAGILKVEGYIPGAIFYLISMFSSSVLITVKAGGSFQRLEDFFTSKKFVFSGEIFSGLLVFVLCWTLAYDLVHVF